MKSKLNITLFILLLGLVLAAIYVQHPLSPETEGITSDEKLSSSTSEVSLEESGANLVQFNFVIDNSLTWQERLKQLRALDFHSLSQKEAAELFSLLRYNPSPEHQESWYVVLNEIMELLRANEVEATKLTSEFIAILENPHSDEVVADYAIQHLSLWLSEVNVYYTSNFGNYLEDSQTAVDSLTQLVVTAELSSKRLTGTALAGLSELLTRQKQSEVEFDFDRLSPLFKKVLEEDDKLNKTGNPIYISNQISIIHFIAQQDLNQYTSDIRKLINSSKTNDSVCLSCIAVLGDIGEKSDIAYLSEIAKHRKKFKSAAISAKHRLQKKLVK